MHVAALTVIKATFQRRVVQSVTLPDGNALAPGTLVLAAADAVASDPAYYPDPDKFDGLRFYNLRSSVGESTKNATHVQSQFVATSKTQLQFGFGRHACPGRWFASHVIKLVVVAMLLEYDFRFKAGEVRPKTFLFQTTNMPHPQNRIMVRKKVE